MKKRIAICLVLLLACFACTTIFAFADEESTASDAYLVEYVDKDGSSKDVKVSNLNKIDSSYSFQNASLQSGWYFVDGNVKVKDRTVISGDVHLILTDGCRITFDNGIQLISGNSLTVYAQTNITESMPHLDAYGHGNDAAIGTRGQDTAGIFTLVGGNVTATSDQGAGIGGGRAYEGDGWANDGPNGGIVNVYSGVLTATSNGESAGIGGGKGGHINSSGSMYDAPKGGAGGTLNVYGGKVYAKSSGWQALGGGKNGTKDRSADGKVGEPIKVNFFNSSMDTIGEINKDKNVTISEFITVTFRYRANDIADVTQVLEKGTIPSKPQGIAIDSKTVYNWCFDTACEQVYDFTPLYEDTDLYANWKGDVRVVFIYQDKVTPIKITTVPYGSKIAKPADPVRDGYTLMGWYDDFDYRDAQKFDFNQPLTADVDLYAIWEKNPTVTFDYNDSKTEATKVTVNYDSKLTKPTDPVRDGYTFMGWYDGPDYKQAKAYDFTKPVTSSTVLYAGWEKNLVVTFDYGGRISSEQQVVSYGGNVKLPESKVADRMVVDSWYLDPELTNPFDAAQTLTEDLTLYGKWVDCIPYVDSDGQFKALGITQATTIDSQYQFSNSQLESGWYYVKDKITVGNRINIKGNVNVILEDGCDIKFDQGIKLMTGNSLSVYSTSLDKSAMGRLEAYGHDLNAAIGTDGESGAGTFTLYGGRVTAIADRGAGIGGGQGYAGGEWANDGPGGATVNVYNGIISATSKGKSAAIGGGKGGDMTTWGAPRPASTGGEGGFLNYYGGDIYAKSAGWQAIGGGYGGDKPRESSGNPGAKANVKLFAEATVKGGFNKDSVVEITALSNAAATVISEGNLWIIIGIAVIAIGVIAGIAIKKKAVR